MKRFITSFFTLLLSATLAFAESNESVSLVSYEQTWLDYDATIVLKNNTNEPIENVTFRIIYFDMNGVQLDYQDFTKEIDIEPGMSRTLTIKAFRRSDDYSYYKSKAAYSDPHKYKIEYQLISFNEEEEDAKDSYYGNSSFRSPIFSGVIPGSLVLIICLFLYIFLISISGKMARRRGMNPGIWVLISIIFTPILCIFILLFFEKDDTTRLTL